MATAFTNFGSGTIGVAPSGFAEMGADGLATWTIEAVAGATAGKVLRASYLADGAGSNRAGLLWTGAPLSTGTVEVVAKMRLVAGASVTWYGPAVDAITRGRFGDPDNDGVRGQVRRNSNILRLIGFSAFSDVAWTPGTDWFWARVRRVGRYVSVRLWMDGDDEPTGWDIDSFDLGVHRLGGQPALFVEGAGAATIEFDQIGVGTDGDAAPREYVLVPGRMRDLTNRKRELLARDHAQHVRFRAVNGAGDLVDLTSFLRALTITISRDQKVASVVAELAWENDDGESLSPLIENSEVNTDGAGGYAPALYPARFFDIYGGITEVGELPTDDDWVLILEGRTGEPDFSSTESIRWEMHDSGDWLQRRQIQDEVTYSTPSQPVEDLIQAILNAWQTHPTRPVDILVVQGTLDWFLDRHTQAPVRLMEAISALADQFGADIRFDWITGNLFALVISLPRRDVTVPDTTWSPSEYKELPVARIEEDGVRNLIRIWYRDEAGKLHSRTTENGDSIAIFGYQFFQLAGEPVAAISNDAEADRMIESAVADLGFPQFEHAYRLPWFPYAMLGDFFGFSANDLHYDADQEGSVEQIVHEWREGEPAWTTIQVPASKPRSAYRRWLEKADERQPPDITITATDLTNGKIEVDAVVNSRVVRIEVWSRTGADPRTSGVPGVRYSKGRWRPEDFPIQFDAPSGTQHVVVRGFAENGDFAEDDATVATTGGAAGGGISGDSPDVPGEPNIRPIGVPSGGMLQRRARWVNTNNTLLPQIQWLEDGVVVATHTLAAAATSEDRTTSDSVAVSVRVRYTDGGGVNFGPWSDYSNEV